MEKMYEQLRILIRAEMTLFKAEARRTRTSMLLISVAIGCGLLGVILFNFGMFYYLTDNTQASEAAFILCALNLLLALIPVVINNRLKPGMEEGMVREIRDQSAEEISRQASNFHNDINGLHKSVRQLKQSISGGGVGSVKAALPVVNIILDAMKKTRR